MAVIKNNRVLKCLLLMVVSLLLVLGVSIGVSASSSYDGQEADACITISERLSVKGGRKLDLADYYEYKVLRQQGYNASEAYDLMKQFQNGKNPNNDFLFHFTTYEGGKGITDIGGIKGSKSGFGGKGIYAGTTPTPSWALKHIPIFGWGLGKAPVRIPIKITPNMEIKTPILPLFKTRVIPIDFMDFN